MSEKMKKNSIEKNTTEKNTAEKKVTEKKVTEKKVTEKKATEKKSANSKADQNSEVRSEVKIRRRPNSKQDENKSENQGEVIVKAELEDSNINNVKTEKKSEKTEKTEVKKKSPRSSKDNKKIHDTPARIVSPAKVIEPVAMATQVIEEPKQTAEVIEAQEQNKSLENVQSDVSHKDSSASEQKPENMTAKVKVEEESVQAIAKPESVKSENVKEESVKSENVKADSTDKVKNTDKTTPAASAAPDKNNAKSILPPINSKANRVNEDVSQVRVISRPDINAVKAEKTGQDRQGERRYPRDGQRPGQRDGQRDGQRERFSKDKDGRDFKGPRSNDGRPNDGRPNDGRFQRDGNRDSRPVRDNKDNKDGRDFNKDRAGQRPRPNTPFGGNRVQDKDAAAAPQRPRPPKSPSSGPRQEMGFGIPPIDNDQSRKKKNKGRRTVDFSANENQENLRRRNNIPMGLDDDENFRHRRARKPKKQQQQHIVSTQPMKAAKRKIRFDEAIRVIDLAQQLSVKSSEVIKVLFGLGIMATINNALDIDTAILVASEFGYEVENVGFSENNLFFEHEVEKNTENQKPRPPVVTIMGHVDHGKTSLLDAIRKTSVTTGEAGGITQHIGAYHVKTKNGDIVFLDTPGHEAFTAMRARGAQVTDLVVLVVAADDGVMEQTREAINHSKAANVPIMVAVNKIDKEAANLDRVFRELSEQGLLVEDWGGDVVTGKVSAKTGQGLDELLELIALQAEVLELKANPEKAARGRVVEAKLDKGRGPVATVLIQEGTLRQGDNFVCGVFAGRVRAFFNDQGKKIKEAGPSIPVEIQGFDGVPEAGEEFICLTDEKSARRIAESRAVKLREKELAKKSRVTLETFLASTPKDAEAQVLNLVLKADVQGSLEAITDALHKQSNEKVRISVIHSGAGAITETDIMLAAASHAIIIGFNVRPTAKVKEVAEKEMVDIRFYDIIYKLVEEIRSAMTGMLAPVSREVYLGQAEVRQTFSVPKIGLVAGCMVNDGKLMRNAGARLLRDGVVVYTGKLSSLRRIKDDVKEVTKGFECGVGLENFNDIKIADVIECFEYVEEAPTL